MSSLNNLLGLQRRIIQLRILYLNRVWKMRIDPTARISMTAKLDKTHPRGVRIGERSYIAFGATILCHDMTRGLYLDTAIGRYCFIGARSLIMPGVTIGDGSIVAAGAVVTRDVPPRSIVAGNPATVIRSDIEVGPYGRFLSAGMSRADRAAYEAAQHGQT
ncbi:acyltransferase [Novosphingobium sp. UBA1939]|uniref:acyltransferase n=1 Tax=Novosphingobium sp. UBA1939 TaxID=1946982 RepID=UPI0026009001|nr:acyltransferase [Novosphingobium sp. UBA1939]